MSYIVHTERLSDAWPMVFVKHELTGKRAKDKPAYGITFFVEDAWVIPEKADADKICKAMNVFNAHRSVPNPKGWRASQAAAVRTVAKKRKTPKAIQ